LTVRRVIAGRPALGSDKSYDASVGQRTDATAAGALESDHGFDDSLRRAASVAVFRWMRAVRGRQSPGRQESADVT